MTSGDMVQAPRLSGKIVFFLGCAAFGALLGSLVYGPLLGGFSAIGILSIGVVPVTSFHTPAIIDDGLVQLPIERGSDLVERSTSEDFTRLVGKRLADDAAALSLTAPRYGGAGNLRVRVLRDNTQLEVRVSAASADAALMQADAVLDEMVAQHQLRIVPYLNHNAAVIAKYEEELRLSQALDTQLAQATETISQSDDQAVQYAAIVAARGQARAQSLQATRALDMAELSILSPFLQRTRILVPSAIVRPMLSSPIHTGLLGAVAALAFGFALMQMRRMIV